jgi:TRAP-type uncharacterized transport system substrate-binding protein
LLGRRELADFDDLAGKRVAIGKEGSGTYLTAKLLFEVSDVEPGEMVSVGTDEALAQSKGGGHRRNVLCSWISGQIIRRRCY